MLKPLPSGAAGAIWSNRGDPTEANTRAPARTTAGALGANPGTFLGTAGATR